MDGVNLLVRFTLGGKNITFDVRDKKDADLLSYILKKLDAGDARPTEVVRYDERFLDYLLKDRVIDERTARDYMRNLMRLDGVALNYDLYLRVGSDKWMVKTARLCVDYLSKERQTVDNDAEGLLKVFRVKNQIRGIQVASVDPS